nr:hypothetical protein [Angustibacter aerolatus]
MSDDAAAVRAFVLRLARAEATSVVDVPGGIGVRHALYPASYEHNRLLLHEPLPSSQALAAADDVLGAAGLPTGGSTGSATGRPTSAPTGSSGRGR